MIATNLTVKRIPSQHFLEAGETWNLEQLYNDLTDAKRRYRASQRQRITKTEKTHLRGLLCGYSPAEIAAELHRDCGGLRVDWSRGLYRYIEMLTNESLKDWKDIVTLLAKYRRQPHLKVISQPTISSFSSTKIDCYEAVDASVFYGRETELATLKQWVVKEGCRMVAVRGMTGIGKTTLVSKLIPSLQTKFDYIIWRNISHAPPLIQILADLIEFLSDKQDKKFENWHLMHQSIQQSMRSMIPLLAGSSVDVLAESPFFQNEEMQEILIAEGIRVLMQCLQQHRCLIILDGWEALFQPQSLAGNYLKGYQNYGKLLKQIGKLKHQSCLMLTTTEVPKAVTYLSGCDTPVRTLTLGGLGKSAELLLQNQGLLDYSQYSALIQKYSGHPQALQIVAEMIHNLFADRVAKFLAINSHAFLGDFSDYLASQFNRLSTIEKQALLTLATMRMPVCLKDLKAKFQPDEIAGLMQALESLERRSLISMTQTSQDTFYQLNRLMSDYLTHNNMILSRQSLR
jgi:hypothetical protein